MAAGTRWRRLIGGVCAKLLCVVGLACLLSAMAGCKRTTEARADNATSIGADSVVSPEEVIKAYRSCLVSVQTTWEAKSSFLGGWESRGQEGTALVVASDGRSALVLTSRHLVDPRYRRDPSIQTRDVAFRVFVNGASKNARLVAVYINDADLALLRIGAPEPAPFAIPLARVDSLHVGDEVIVVGPPANTGLVNAQGVLESFSHQRPLGRSSMQIRLTDGRPATAGVVFTRRGGRLIGVLRGQEYAPEGVIGDLHALSTDSLLKLNHWSYLIEKSTTRSLLASIH